MKVYPRNVILRFHEKEEEEEEKICRICYEKDETKSKLLAPCGCSGTMKYIHDHCLREWITTKNISISEHRCELCEKKLFLKKLYKEEKLKLWGTHKYVSKYAIDFFSTIIVIYFISFIFYSLDQAYEYKLVNSLDIYPEKTLLKVITNELRKDTTAYFYFYFSFSYFIILMLYYLISLICILTLRRKKLFFKINLLNLSICIFFSSSFFMLYIVYVLFGDISAAETFVYTSGFLSFFLNWPVVKIYCFNFNDYVKLMNRKYNKIEILNVTFNPLSRRIQMQIDL